MNFLAGGTMPVIDLFVSSFERGGIIMWPILGVSLVVWVIGLDKLFELLRVRRARQEFLHALEKLPSGKEAQTRTGDRLYDALLSRLGLCVSDSHSSAFLFREFLLDAVPGLDKGFATMSAWISVAPLLGLLGTVTGMIHTFGVITQFGIGNPHLTAEGISIALLTTQAGLTVAFPAMLFHNYLANRKSILVTAMVRDGDRLARTLADRADQGDGRNG